MVHQLVGSKKYEISHVYRYIIAYTLYSTHAPTLAVAPVRMLLRLIETLISFVIDSCFYTFRTVLNLNPL